jgi:hypothetical protein
MQALEGGESQQIWLKHDEGGRIAWIQRAKPESHELPTAKRKDAPAKYPIKAKRPKGAGNKVSADWIESVITAADWTGSQRAAGRFLREHYEPINPDEPKPVEGTFINALKEHFTQCETTEKWTRK